jgi:hypothetical protein
MEHTVASLVLSAPITVASVHACMVNTGVGQGDIESDKFGHTRPMVPIWPLWRGCVQNCTATFITSCDPNDI